MSVLSGEGEDTQTASQAWANEIADEGRAWGRAWGATIRETVRDLVRPIPSTFEDAVNTLRGQVSDALAIEVPDNFARIGSSLSDWEGQAATEFAEYFYTQVEASVRNQVAVAEFVCTGLAGSKMIVHQGQHSLMGLMIAAKEALDTQLQNLAAEHELSDPSTSDYLLMGATVLAVLGAIPTGGASLTVAAAAAGAATATGALLTYASTQVEGGKSETFRVTSAQDSVDGLMSEIKDIQDRVRVQWDALEGKVSGLHALVKQAENENRLYPVRPRMVDGRVDPTDWHHESAGR